MSILASVTDKGLSQLFYKLTLLSPKLFIGKALSSVSTQVRALSSRPVCCAAQSKEASGPC